jgi:Tfp pilus assembly protein PilX
MTHAILPRQAQRQRRAQRSARPARGTSTLVVLVVLTVMLLGSLALARITEVSTLATGNVASAEAAVQASEVGLNTAFAAARALTDEETSTGNWYYAAMQTTDSAGIPQVSFDSAPEVVVGSYSVRYVVERMCSVAPVVDTLSQCLVRQIPQIGSNREGVEQLDPPNSRQFRLTVRVTGPKSTQVWVQSMVTRGT